jgi:hypothetical protein
MASIVSASLSGHYSCPTASAPSDLTMHTGNVAPTSPDQRARFPFPWQQLCPFFLARLPWVVQPADKVLTAPPATRRLTGEQTPELFAHLSSSHTTNANVLGLGIPDWAHQVRHALFLCFKHSEWQDCIFVFTVLPHNRTTRTFSSFPCLSQSLLLSRLSPPHSPLATTMCVQGAPERWSRGHVQLRSPELRDAVLSFPFRISPDL